MSTPAINDVEVSWNREEMSYDEMHKNAAENVTDAESMSEGKYEDPNVESADNDVSENTDMEDLTSESSYNDEEESTTR